jgi:hypothetical protein
MSISSACPKTAGSRLTTGASITTKLPAGTVTPEIDTSSVAIRMIGSSCACSRSSSSTAAGTLS